MKQRLFYSLKIWLTVAVVNFIAISVGKSFGSISKYYSLYYDLTAVYHVIVNRLYYLASGALLYILLPIGLYLTTSFLAKRGLPVSLYKWYLMLVGVLSVTLPFLIIIVWVLAQSLDKTYTVYVITNFGASLGYGVAAVIICVQCFSLKWLKAMPSGKKR